MNSREQKLEDAKLEAVNARFVVMKYAAAINDRFGVKSIEPGPDWVGQILVVVNRVNEFAIDAAASVIPNEAASMAAQAKQQVGVAETIFSDAFNSKDR